MTRREASCCGGVREQRPRERPSDRALLEQCRRGDVDAWASVVARYERLVYSIPLSYGLRPEDAADVTQHTFVTLVRSLGRIRDQERLGSWLATIARRRTWRLLEGARRAGDAERERASSIAVEDDPSEGWAGVVALHDALGQLDERCRALILALYFEAAEPSYADIADRLGMPVGSVGPTRARCLGKLRAVLGEP